MTLLRLTWRLFAVVTMMVAGQTAMGQGFHPFAEAVELDPDWQFFAPVDVDAMAELSPRKRAHEGWFAAYDRIHMWASRPNVEASSRVGDFGWGNRFDIGFMTEKDTGWLFSGRSMGGPNVYDTTLVERIDRINDDDLNDPNAPVFPPSDRNDPQLGYRAYVLGDSLNVLGLNSFELNRTWRREPYRYGGILEPMVGLRYTSLRDTSLNESYFRSNALIGTPGTVSATTDVETLVSDTMLVRNQMFGGQLGARYFTHINRWTLSSEFRAAGMANFQSGRRSSQLFVTEYDGLGGDVVITDNFTSSTVSYEENTEFALVLEARAEAAYQVTKYLNIRGGIDMVNFTRGIWRGANNIGQVAGAVDHDQDALLMGFTFGITLNR